MLGSQAKMEQHWERDLARMKPLLTVMACLAALLGAPQGAAVEVGKYCNQKPIAVPLLLTRLQHQLLELTRMPWASLPMDGKEAVAAAASIAAVVADEQMMAALL